MTSQDIFAKYIPLSTDNFLQVPIKVLSKNASNDEIKVALSQLNEIKEILKIAQRSGLLQNIGGHIWYLNALRWLNQETALGDFIHVTQLMTDINNADQLQTSLFLQYVQQMVNSLKQDPTYQQIVNAKSILRSITTTKIQAESEALVESTASMINNLAEQGSQSVNQSVVDANLSVSNHVENELNNAISKFKVAQNLEDWGEEYIRHIDDLKTRLFGHFPKNIFAKNIRTIELKIKVTRYLPVFRKRKNLTANLLMYMPRTVWNIMLVIFRAVRLIVKNLISYAHYLVLRTRSFSFQRAFWFTCLLVLILFFVSTSLMSAYGVATIIPSTRNTESEFGSILWKISLFLPLTVLFGLAYSFAVKNYRIYSNMLDQYEHRRIVARTSKGIILSLQSESESEVRKTMTAAAAQALFEHRNTGHLSKKEAESTSLLEIFKILGR